MFVCVHSRIIQFRELICQYHAYSGEDEHLFRLFPESVFTFNQNECSRSAGLCSQVAQCANTSVYLLWPHLHVCIVRPDPVCARAMAAAYRPRHYTMVEVAEHFGVSRTTVGQALKENISGVRCQQ